MPKPVNRVEKYGPGGFWFDTLSAAEQMTLRQMARSKDVHARRRCAEWLKQAASVKENHPLVLELADVLIPDRDNSIRWGILTIALSPRLMPWDVADLWPLVVKWGSVKNTDIRNAVAICVLEHILENNFREYFDRARRLIEAGNKRFAYTLVYCGKWGEAEEKENAREIDAFFATLPPYPYKPRYSRPTAPTA